MAFFCFCVIYYNYGDNMNKKNIIVIFFGVLVVALLVILLISKNKEKLMPKLIVNDKEVTVRIGDAYRIDAYIENYPDAEIIWESSDDSVASVTNGIIKGNNYGSATIRIIYSYGDNLYLTDKCLVKVISGDANIKITSLSFAKGDLLVGLGKSFNVNDILEIIPKNGSIESKAYDSSNRKIIDIDNVGVMRCLSTGKSTITAKFNDSISDLIDVYCVNENIYSELVINPTSIKLNDEKIKIGETKKINYIVEPLDASTKYFSFSVQDKSIVSLDDFGYIKGLKSGTTKVIITSITGLTASCTITVEKEPVLAKLINVEKENIELNVNDKYVLTPVVLPADAENKTLSFESSDNNVISLTNNGQNSVTIKGLKSGSSIITIKTTNGIIKQVVVIVKAKEVTSNNQVISTTEFTSGTPTIISTGNVNSALMSSPTDSGFDECRNVSPNLTLKINGKTIGQDGSVSIGVGQYFRVEVYLPTKCGRIMTLTRTSSDGSSSWGEYFKQNDNPYVDRYNSSTYLSGVSKYTWTIAAITSGSSTLSQTAQFDVLSPNGRKANIKSMIRLKVKAT